LDCLPFAGVCSKGWFPVEAANLNMRPIGVHLAASISEEPPRKQSRLSSSKSLNSDLFYARQNQESLSPAPAVYIFIWCS
jgi:hypothetical protein